MSRRSATINVSLFPFLAVLLCAMGALIVLLVILTHEIREDALHSAKQQSPATPVESPLPPLSPSPSPKIVITRPAPPVEAPTDPNVEIRAQLAELQGSRDELEDQLKARRADLADAEAKQDRLKERMQSARFSHDADQQRLKARLAELDEQRAQIEAIESQIAQSAADLEAAEQAVATADAKLQIIPYDGRSGTARTPILIECTADSIRFVPEDVALTPDDIQGFRPSFNPLLAGAAALRNYWAVNGDPASSRPYILLLVREDGIIAYYAARSLLESLGADTGYELITDDQEIAYPELDPEAREVCRDAVREALELRSAAEFSLAQRDSDFRNGRFDVDPREHDPTQPDDEDNLYPVRPPSSSNSEDARSVTSSPLATPAPSSPPMRQFEESEGPSAPRRQLVGEPRRPEDEPDVLESLSPPGPPPFPRESLEDVADAGSQRDWSRSGRESSNDQRQWGTSSPRAIISLERPVHVSVSEDLIQIADQPALLVGPEGLNETILEDVFRGISMEADQWGAAPENFYWTPHIKAAIEPGGEYTFTRLRTAMEKAGLRVTDRLELEAGRARRAEGTHATPTH